MADAKDPLHQLIDVAVYAPIGLVLLARKELPNLVASGKARVQSQITLARFIGKLAVKRGGKEVKRRLDAVEAARNQSSPAVDAESVELSIWTAASTPAGVAVENSPEPDVTIPTSARKRSRATHTAVVAEPERGESLEPQPGAALPIDGYDSLAASQVVVRLGTLTADELGVIRRHEESHRARRTIIGKISQLQAR